MKLQQKLMLLALGCCIPFAGAPAMATPEAQPSTTSELPESTTPLLAENPELNAPAPLIAESAPIPVALEPQTSPLPLFQPQSALPVPATASAPLAPAAPSVLGGPIVPTALNGQETDVPSTQANDLKPRDLVAQTGTGKPDELFMPPQLFNLDTANHLKAKVNTVNLGFRWYFPRELLKNVGRGQQVVYGGFSSGLTDRLQLDFGGFYIGDSLIRKVNGLPLLPADATPFAAFGGGYVQGKYQIIQQERLRLSVAGSFELLATGSNFPLFTNNPAQNRRTFNWSPIGSIQVPLTYTITRGLQFHFTPTLAFLPEEKRGGDFYGTSFILGGGVSWQPVKLIGFFADVNYPVGPGGNTVRSDDGDIVRRPVWSGGVRFNIPEFSKINVSLDLYATNAMGTTPATRALAQLPDSDQVSFSSNLTFRF